MSPSFTFTLAEITVDLCHTLVPCWCLAIVHVFCVAIFSVCPRPPVDSEAKGYTCCQLMQSLGIYFEQVTLGWKFEL